MAGSNDEYTPLGLPPAPDEYTPGPTPQPSEYSPGGPQGSADTLAALYQLNTDLGDRNTVADSAVGIVDTLQSIGTILKAPLPGETNTLQQSAINSQILDQLRSPAFLAERQLNALTSNPNAGFVEGAIEGVQDVLSGGNLIADVAAQSPYLLIGPAARAMGVAARGATPGILSKLATGTETPAVINRIAALSGVLEGAGGYAQTYQRALAETGDPVEAERQATLAGAFSAGLGAVLGRATPGFELSPTGRLAGNLASNFTQIGAEVFEEGGLAIGQTVFDNILAGRDPMEGVGRQFGEAAAISSVFTGAIRSPSVVTDTAKEIGKGVRKGIAAASAGLQARATTPEAAATAAAVAAADQGEVIQSTEAGTDTATAGSSSEPGVEATSTETAPSTGENTTQTTSIVEEPAYEIPLGPTTERATSTDENVQRVLAATDLEAATSVGETLTDTQAEQLSAKEEFEEVGKLEEAQAEILKISEPELQQEVAKAQAGDEQAQLKVEAVAATDIARLPLEVVPEPLKPVVQALKSIPAASRVDDVSDQILNRGFESNGKVSKKRRGMGQYAQAVINSLRTATGGRDTDTPVPMARRMAAFMKQLEQRGVGFAKAQQIMNDLDKDKTSHPEIWKQGYIDVEGSETLDENGRVEGPPFRVWLNNDKSRAVVGRALEDVANARRIYDATSANLPRVFRDAEAWADLELARKARRKAESRGEEAPAPAPVADPETTSFIASSGKVAVAVLKRLTELGVKASTAGQRITNVPYELRAQVQAILSEEESKVGEKPNEREAQSPLTEAQVEAIAERAAIQAVEQAEEARINKERADAERDAKAERDAIQSVEREAEARLAREDAAAKPADVPDTGVDSNPVEEPSPQSEAVEKKNPLLAAGVKWVTDLFQKSFNINPDTSVEGFMAQLDEEGRTLLNRMARELFADMKKNLVTEGVLKLSNKDAAEREAKPYGVASHLWVEGPNGEMTVPDEVLRAYATAAAITLIRVGSRYNTAVDENGDIRRDAIPAAWAAEIARDAQLLLGVKGKRKVSLSITQGLPLAYGLMAVQALVNSKKKDGTPILSVETAIALNGFKSQVLVPDATTHEFAKNQLKVINRALATWGGETVWEASTEPYTTVPETIQYSDVKLSDKIKTALLNRQKVPHSQNKHMQKMLETLKSSSLLQLLTGQYGDLPADTPSHVRDYLESVRTGWINEMISADHYDGLSEKGTKPLFFKYEIGSNGRSKSVRGPQTDKLLRDLYSSAFETLDLTNADHRLYLTMAIAQAFGVKTDINGPKEVEAEWEKIRAPIDTLAREVNDALEAGDAAKVMSLLKNYKDTAWAPRELNALLTLGRWLKHGNNTGFDNYLSFEIDGKTNGAFNTELFFGLGAESRENLEQGGLFLDKPDTSWEQERARVEKLGGKDFYTRVNKRAEEFFRAILKKQTDKNPKIAYYQKQQNELLAAAGFLTLNEDGSFSFSRLAGKVASIPVQYGGSVRGVKSQLWGEIAGALTKSYLETEAKLQRLEAFNPKPGKQTEQKAAKLKQLRIQKAKLASMMEGMDSFRATDFETMTADQKRWHNATTNLAKALLQGYQAEKPMVMQMTDLMVRLTNFAFAVKKAQWKNEIARREAADPLNQKLRKEYGEKAAAWALSAADYADINRGTIDMSFSTLAGPNVVSLNDTEFERDSFKVPGFATKFTGNLNIPTPKEPGVRVLALLTIAAGDAAMGNEFLQAFRAITDVYDGIEFKVTEFMDGGEALNDAVWKTFQFDVLKDFFPLMAAVEEKLAQVAEASEATRQMTENELFDIGQEIVDAYNSIQKDEAEQIASLGEFVQKMRMTVSEFENAYAKHRKGAQALESRSHTLVQMGGGRGKTTQAVPVRDSLDDLSLVEDEAPRLMVDDLSESGTREEGLYPKQPKTPGTTRIETSEGLIDVDMRGDRWRGRNTWNSPNARKGAGIRRLIKVLKMAARAGKPYDSDKSVHPSALKMYMRAIDAGIITAELAFPRQRILDAIANNEVLRTDNSASLEGEPVFRNVRLIGRAAKGAVRNDLKMDNMFAVRNNVLDRAGVIAALDSVTWPTAIQRAVWKRIRNLLPADLMMHLATTEEQWNTLRNQFGHGRRYGSVNATAIGSTVLLATTSSAIMLHEVIHTVFTRTISNYFSNINQVPVEMRGPINDLVQLMERFKKLAPVGRVGFVQKVMNRLEFMGDSAAALDEMLTYVISEQDVIEQLSPGFFTRVVNRVKQVLSKIINITVPREFLDDVMDTFHQLADNVPVEPRYPDPLQPTTVRDSLSSLEQLTEDAYVDLMQRMAWQQNVPLRQSVNTEIHESLLQAAAQHYNLSAEQGQLFTRIYTLLRVGQRPGELEQFVQATFPQHPNRDMFKKSPDLVAAVMALAAVEDSFRAQLETLWQADRQETGVVESLVDKALNNAQSASVEKMLTDALSAILVDREYNQSFLGSAISRLDRLSSRMLERIGEKAREAAQRAPTGAAELLKGIDALTSEKGADAFGAGLLQLVNEVGNQRWLQDLAAALIGTQGDGKLLYRAHDEMMSAINQTRAIFTTSLPKALKELFPDDFDGWTTLYDSFGRLDVGVLGRFAADMYLNDRERRRMITVLESKVDNWIDAQNLGYYLVHRKPKPGMTQELLRNARAIADNLNGTPQRASDALVADVDQLVTLYAIEFLEASERAKVAGYFRDHREAMDNLVGMLKHTKDASTKDSKHQYRYVYWKDSLPLQTDPRASVVIAGAVKGAQLEQLGYVKGKRYPRTAGDPQEMHYYTRKYSPPPVFTQGVIATVQQTAMGINYATASTISPEVGTMITNRQLVEYIQQNKGRDSTLIPVHNFQGEIVGYERLLDPAIVREGLKAENTQLHLSIGAKLGRITEEKLAHEVNRAAVQLMVNDWKAAQGAGLENEYESVNSSTDKQVARSWEVVPADVKTMLEEAFDGPVMVRKHLLANVVGYHKAGLLEIFTGDASIEPTTRKALLGLVQTVFMGPKGTQILLGAEQALKEGVATAKDLIIVRSLSVPINNFMSAVNQVFANGVPLPILIKRYRQGMKELRDYYRLQREVIELTVKIAGAAAGDRERLRTLQTAKRRSIERLSIYPLIQAGQLTDLPEGLEETPNHSYLGDLAGWMDKHLREKVHPKAPVVVANALFAKDTMLHDAMSKAIQAGDFLARYTIYMHQLDQGADAQEAMDVVRDELIAYQMNPGRMRAMLEDYGLVWWSQFTLRAQNVLLRRFRRNPFSFFVTQGMAGISGTPGPLDYGIMERGVDTSLGMDNIVSAPSAYIWSKIF